MKHCNKVKALVGRPFTKGDPRINRKLGPRTKEAASFAELYKNALAKKITPDELAIIIIKWAKIGRPWAIEMLRDDLVGKPTQPLEITGGLKFEFGENGMNEKE